MAGEDFISEVDRSLRERRIFRVLLPIIAVVSVLILISVWAWNAWEQNRFEKWENDTRIYYNSSQALKNLAWVILWQEPEKFDSEDDKKKTLDLVETQKQVHNLARASIESLSKESSSPYVRFLSTLTLMSNSMTELNLDGIRKYATYFTDDKSNGDAFRDFVSLSFARYLMSFENEKEALGILSTLGLKSPVLKVPSKELEAFALLSLDEKGKSREVFKSILSMPNVPDPTLERAEIYAYNIS